MNELSLGNVEILIDEIAQARIAFQGGNQSEYARGYWDGLSMALDILEGNIE